MSLGDVDHGKSTLTDSLVAKVIVLVLPRNLYGFHP